MHSNAPDIIDSEEVPTKRKTRSRAAIIKYEDPSSESASEQVDIGDAIESDFEQEDDEHMPNENEEESEAEVDEEQDEEEKEPEVEIKREKKEVERPPRKSQKKVDKRSSKTFFSKSYR